MSVRIGQPVLRKEDLRLITGQGRYSDDLKLPGEVRAVMVRSPHAHARIASIATQDALAAPGVLAVFTGADCDTDGLRSIPHTAAQLPGKPDAQLVLREGHKLFASPYMPLPSDKVRFVGEAVAMVVAETLAAAKEAAELVEVDYEPLPAVTMSLAAAEPGAPQVWENSGSNICLDATAGNFAATETAFAHAAHVVRFSSWIQRVAVVPMEPRAAVAIYDVQTGRYTLYTGSGNAVRQKRELAHCLNVPEDHVRVVCGDVGGNFGTRNAFYPELALVAWAARRIGRPVKWTGDRQEALLTDYQGRDLAVDAELALDRDGKFLALRSTNTSNIGAHAVLFVPLVKGVGLMSGAYDIPVAAVNARAVSTNTVPTNSYRSSGRPEAMFVIERLIDLAAREHGFDRVEIRRRNLVAESAMPYRNPLGLTYDSGAYERAMDAALALGDWDGFPDRRAKARENGLFRGIGVANYVEIASGLPRERTEITVKPSGRVEVVIGTQASGQGHETSFAQLVTEWFGVPFGDVDLVTGDTDRVPVGGGSHAGRSMRLASIVMTKAMDEIIAKGTSLAARLLDADDSEVTFADGRFSLKDGERGMFLQEVAAAAVSGSEKIPHNLRGPLSAVCDETMKDGAYPYGSQVCEVEIDPETGLLKIINYVAVDDVGRAVNPLIVDGQTHGAIVQGVGQALMEQCVYDPDSGQLLSGSFMDYAMPRAECFPSFVTKIMEVPSPNNRLGIRAGGEGGTTPALAVVINAIVDALSEFGVRHVEMPATSERIWSAIRGAQAAPACSTGRIP